MRGFPVPLGPVGYPLPAYTSLGSYPIVYLDSRDRCLCAGCANDPTCEYGPAVVCDAYEGGRSVYCEGCEVDIKEYYVSAEPD